MVTMSKTLTAFTRWNAKFMGSYPGGVLDYSIPVVLHAGGGLSAGLSPVRGVLPSLCKIKKSKNWPSNKEMFLRPLIIILLNFYRCSQNRTLACGRFLC
jgi:hypothetical protein